MKTEIISIISEKSINPDFMGNDIYHINYSLEGNIILTVTAFFFTKEQVFAVLYMQNTTNNVVDYIRDLQQNKCA